MHDSQKWSFSSRVLITLFSILCASCHDPSCLWSAAVVVQVLKRGDTKKYFAKLLCIGDDCDLALMVSTE